jgi:hypothetical protein
MDPPECAALRFRICNIGLVTKENCRLLKVGAVKRAAEENFGAVKGWKRAVNLEKSSREGSAGPDNPEHNG